MALQKMMPLRATPRGVSDPLSDGQDASGRTCVLGLDACQDAEMSGVRASPIPQPCQSLVLIAGSDGFEHGNCIVFFPANVAAHDKVDEQPYAMFFYNKMREIHETYALPGAEAVLTAESVSLASSGLAPEVCFEARAILGLPSRLHALPGALAIRSAHLPVHELVRRPPGRDQGRR
jgi:hypothetical protein